MYKKSQLLILKSLLFLYSSFFLSNIALAKDNQINTRTPNVVVQGKAIKPIHSKRLALVIGINSYPHKPLVSALKDAKAVKQRLIEIGFEVKALFDKDATLANIKQALGGWLKESNPDDEVLIYFAGHGVTENLYEGKKEGYILPIDYDLKKIYSTAISMEELRDLTRRIPARHILYVLDSCFSGLGLTKSRAIDENTGTIKRLKKLAKKRAVYMITAGKENQLANEVYDGGLFTLRFLEGIAGAADTSPKDNVVQATELGEYLAKKVAEDSQRYNNRQDPQYGLLEGDGDYFFILNPEDPKRLRESTLAKLSYKANELSIRKSIQDDFNRLQKTIDISNKLVKDEYATEIKNLDMKIKEKQEEVNQLNQLIKNKNVPAERTRYSMINFINTGKEFDVLKIHKNIMGYQNYLLKIIGSSYHDSKVMTKNITIGSSGGVDITSPCEIIFKRNNCTVKCKAHAFYSTEEVLNFINYDFLFDVSNICSTSMVDYSLTECNLNKEKNIFKNFINNCFSDSRKYGEKYKQNYSYLLKIFSGASVSRKTHSSYSLSSKLSLKNPYSKVISYIGNAIPKQHLPFVITPSKGIIDLVELQFHQPSYMLKDIKSVQSPLINDKTIVTEWIKFWFFNIDNENKDALTYDQLKNKLISRYGKPTRVDKYGPNIFVVDWKTGYIEEKKTLIWEDKNSRITFSGSTNMQLNDLLFIKIENKSSLLQNLFDQADKLFELEETILLKQRVEKMAEKERLRAKEINSIKF